MTVGEVEKIAKDIGEFFFQIRAIISIPAVPPPAATTASSAVTPGCKLIPALEILDSISGRTQVVLGHVGTVPSVVTANQ